SVLVEQVFSTLLAPAMMLFHTSFVVSILAGRPVSWNTQERGDRGIRFLEALNRHKWHILLAIVWGAALLAITPRYFYWMVPILAGLILSVPLTMFTSRASVGRWMRRHGLLLTPEETNPPAELRALEERLTTEPDAQRPRSLPARDPGRREPIVQMAQLAAASERSAGGTLAAQAANGFHTNGAGMNGSGVNGSHANGSGANGSGPHPVPTHGGDSGEPDSLGGDGQR